MNDTERTLNRFLVQSFHELLRAEERCLSKGNFNDLSLKELHVIEVAALCAAERIELTARGSLANDTHRAFHEEMVRQVVSELSEEDARVFMRGLESVSRFFANKYGKGVQNL